MLILGISSFYHDSAAVLFEDGNIIAAIQEERCSRMKHDPKFPGNAVSECLNIANKTLDDVDEVVFFEKPFLKFERIIEIATRTAPKSWKQFYKSIPLWLKEKLFQKNIIINELKSISSAFDAKKLKFSDHHLSHAASAFFASPFDEAITITMDGVGEWATTTISKGQGNTLETLYEINYPHSLGLLYSAFTYFCGFRVNSGEYKLMGLAPYGNPIYYDLIVDNLIDIKPDGSFRLEMDYFGYLTGLEMTGKKFEELFKVNRRLPETELTQIYMDLAASIQKVTETIVLRICSHARKMYPDINNLCLSGGVALNCVANGKISQQGIFDNIWVQPASGDAGGALGACLAYYYMGLGKDRSPQKPDMMQGAYLGRSFDDAEIEKLLQQENWKYECLTDKNAAKKVASLLANGNVVGRFFGREEFGPRALGNRSILADPTAPEMQLKLNLKIKFREGFRPFAPSVMTDKYKDWFEFDQLSPYMLFTCPVKKEKRILPDEDAVADGLKKLYEDRSVIQAVTHIDYSARLQTVSPHVNKEYYDLIAEFNKLTNIPLIVNTSFNVRGEPIVGSPKDALFCFMATDMDALQLGNFLLKKEDQSDDKAKAYKQELLLND